MSVRARVRVDKINPACLADHTQVWYYVTNVMGPCDVLRTHEMRNFIVNYNAASRTTRMPRIGRCWPINASRLWYGWGATQHRGPFMADDVRAERVWSIQFGKRIRSTSPSQNSWPTPCLRHPNDILIFVLKQKILLTSLTTLFYSE